MSRALRAGAAYFAFVFALGFVMGTARVLALEPILGETRATLLELPVMLAASWGLCGWCVRRFGVPARLADRATMGAFAFALMMLAELSLSIGLMDRSGAAHFARYDEFIPALGLLAQLAFAAFPVVRR